MGEINLEDMSQGTVWGPDLGSPAQSFATEYYEIRDTSNVSCVVGRRASNNVNFVWKPDLPYRFRTGYKLFADESSTEPLAYGDGSYDNFEYQFNLIDIEALAAK